MNRWSNMLWMESSSLHFICNHLDAVYNTTKQSDNAFSFLLLIYWWNNCDGFEFLRAGSTLQQTFRLYSSFSFIFYTFFRFPHFKLTFPVVYQICCCAFFISFIAFVVRQAISLLLCHPRSETVTVKLYPPCTRHSEKIQQNSCS